MLLSRIYAPPEKDESYFIAIKTGRSHDKDEFWMDRNFFISNFIIGDNDGAYSSPCEENAKGFERPI
jgi:hypothetical protein